MKEEPKFYCICRSSDTQRFMICCDCCNEWYHGDCISITEELAKTIIKFYCLMCRDSNPSLVIEYHKDKMKQGTVRKKKQQSSGRSNKIPRLEDVSNRENRIKFIVDDDDEEEDIDDDDDRDETFKIENEFSEKNRHLKSKSRSRPSRKTTNTRSSNVNKNSRSNKTHRTREKEIYEIEEDPMKQCYGPGCINVARRGSKYCSDACGEKLAFNRMVEILPQRLQDWQRTGSTADALYQKELKAIEQESEAAKRFLEELDIKQKELDSMILEAKKLPPISEDEADDSESGDAELMIYCVTCGHEIASSTAMRHMERCFIKFESQISYFGATKTKVDGVFCNVYNSQQKTYCMRLKVLCPEHTKEQRISDSEVCGFPLVINCFEPTGTYCRLPKKKCMRHYCWEKLHQAQLDMEKVQKWFKLEELFEKESKLKYTMANRGAVLGLLLHKTEIQD